MVISSSSRIVLSNTVHHCSAKPIYYYNTKIKALSIDSTFAKHAISIYKQIRSTPGLSPDTYTFPSVLKAVTRLLNLKLGSQVHSQVITLGFYRNVHVATSLIQMYSHCDVGFVVDCRKVFDEMIRRDLVSWNAIITAYVKVGDVENMIDMFERMPDKNVVSWTSVVMGYARADKGREAIEVFKRMMVAGVDPDEVAMLAVLSACSQLGALEFGKWVHDYIGRNRVRRTLSLSNALIDMYAKSGDMGKAFGVFENMTNRCVVTWTTMISGLAAHGMGREALEVFSRMERDRIKPNEVTFVAVLSACSHVGLIEEGKWFFEMMKSRYEIQPRIEHYGCMVDLLGRYGCLEEAEELMNKMPFRANAAIWGSLLTASRIHGNMALAEKSLRNLIMLEPNNSGNYMILSNMYASHDRRYESGIMRKVMKDAGVRKGLGSSSIEVDNKCHEFVSGEKSHPVFRMVDEVLSQIAVHLMSSSEMREEQLMLFAFEDP